MTTMHRQSLRRIAIISLTGLSLSGEALSVDWPEFRGPTAQGHAHSGVKLPIEWSPTKNIVWKQAIPGEGWSSPVLRDGKLFLTTAVPMDESEKPARSLRALCLDESTGKTLWDTQVFQQPAYAPKIHKKNGHASPTPVVTPDKKVYIHFGHQGTACLDMEGKVIWATRSLQYTPVHGNGGSPVVVGDLLFFSCDGGSDPFVVALDRHTGKIVWRKNRLTDAKKKFSFNTPLFVSINGQDQIISLGSNAVMAYAPSDGAEIWRCRYDGYSVIPRPVFGHGLVFLSSGYDRPTFYAIDPSGKGDVTDTHVKWTMAKGAPHTPSPLLVGDELYMVSDGGIATCVAAKTGKEHWKERLCGSTSASPFHADGKIFIHDEAGKGVVIRAGKEFKKLAENDMGERTLASCAVGDDCFYMRTAAGLYKVAGK